MLHYVAMLVHLDESCFCDTQVSCVHVCVYVYISRCRDSCMCVGLDFMHCVLYVVYVFSALCVGFVVCVHACMYVCACMHACVYVCMYVCRYVCVYVCM